MPLLHQRKGIRVGMIEAEHQQARGLARRAGVIRAGSDSGGSIENKDGLAPAQIARSTVKRAKYFLVLRAQGLLFQGHQPLVPVKKLITRTRLVPSPA